MRARTIAVLAGPPLLFALLTASVYSWVRIGVPPRLGAEAQRQILATLRAGLAHEPIAAPAAPGLERELDGPVLVGVWVGGRELVRVEGRGASVAEAVHAAAGELARAGNAAYQMRDRARLKVDVVVASGPLLDIHPLLQAIALHPGVDGLGAELDGGRTWHLLADDMIQSNVLMAGAPIKHVDFRMGLDYRAAEQAMARRHAITPQELANARQRWFRFRTDSFVESVADRAPLQLTRGAPAAPALSASVLRAAAIRGGRYLVAQLAANGRYIYQVELATGRRTDPSRPGPYSIPRHAGTTYFLAELYRITRDEFLREPIERAFAHLEHLVVQGGCSGTLESGAEFACVVDRGQNVTDLGSTALAVVALVEYQRATGSDRYLPLATKLSEWILWMQRADGSFTHRYLVGERRKDDDAYLLYYSGEAALALARMHAITDDARYLEAAERALDHLVGFYDFFLGGFFYGEEHWTCIAAEAAYPGLKKTEYREFCSGYGRFLRAQQLEAGEFPGQDDLAGAYVFTPFAMPQNTPTGSRTEAMISSYLLSQHHGVEDPELRRQIEAAMAFALGQQIRPEFDWFVSPGLVGEGAISTTPVDRVVRIDYVQHVCSAMIRAAVLIESTAP